MSTSSFNDTARTIVCPKCGLRYPIATKFCGQDGTVLEPAMLSQTGHYANGPKHCPACKTIYPSYAQFCPADATKLVTYNPTGQNDRNQGTAPVNTRNTKSTAANQDDQGEDAPLDPLASLETQLVGRVIAGKYKIDSLLGEGGMAQVFKATHQGLDRAVVIKIMHSGLPSMDTALKRFEQECKVTAKIDHPNVVSVFDVGTIEGRRPYLVMEFIQGESMRDFLDREVSMEVHDATNVMVQVCSGLFEAHSQGIVHRDLKPENIMLRQHRDRPDWVKIVDFGIAHLKQGGQRLTRTGIAIGTVDYMSPEYLSDKPIDHRSDVYALGVILYELIAGRCPFVAETAEAIMAKHLWGQPMPLSHYRPDLTAGCMFDKIAERALEKEPDNRYQSVSEMKSDLQKAIKEFEAG